jgi:hypothetical protein
MAHTLKIALLILLYSTAIFGQGTPAPNKSAKVDDLDRPIPKWLPEKELTISEFAARIPVSAGVVFDSSLDRSKKYKLQPATLTVRGLLDAIARAEPRYKWEIKRGIINLIPTGKFPAFLDSIIPNVDLKNVTTLDGFDALENMPEFRTLATGSGYGNFTVPRISNSSRLGNDSPFSFKCTGCNIREIMNVYVRAYGGAVWGFHEFDEKGNRYFAIWLIRN